MISKPLISSSLLIWALASFLFFSMTTPAITGRRKISWDTNITLLGDASLKNGAISLTSPSNNSSSAGRALYSRPIRFLEPTTHSPASFSSRFTFSITPSPSLTFGDGLAFLITSDPKLLGTSKGYMGLFSEEERINNEIVTIAVEFDTSLDAALRDINDNHVAVDVSSIFSMATADAGNAGMDLKGGIPMTAWVDYSSSEKIMRVWVSYSRFRPPNPLLVANVDLSGIFRESMYVGFSASNFQGGSAALHIVQKWGFRTFGFISSSPSSPSKGPPAARGKCPECSPNDQGINNGTAAGDDEFIDPDDIPAVVNPPQGARNLWVGLGVGGALVFLFLVMAISVAGWFLARARRKDSDRKTRQEDLPVARISLDELKSATKEFHCSKIIGQGSFGTMYEGILPSGRKVAVKRFGRVDRFTNTFATELAAVLGCSRHRNLVPLKSWCCEKDELLLVYEYMPNGSLHKILHAAPSAASITLSWDKRFNIILGVASALAFLHEECEKKIIHRDVKTCNILLDADFNPKLGDFGLAKLNEHNRTPQVTQPAGTMGYLAPEYVHSGVPTEKSDVYSFGIVALEVATGRRPMEKGIVLVDWVWGLWGRRKLVEAADQRLERRFSRDEMSRMLTVGLCCAHPDCKQRPSIRKAIRMLKGATPLPALPLRKPAVRLLSNLPQASEETTDASANASSGDAGTPWLTPSISLC